MLILIIALTVLALLTFGYCIAFILSLIRVARSLNKSRAQGGYFDQQFLYHSGAHPEVILEDLPAHLILLLLVREDLRFFSHRGIHWSELIRAIKHAIAHPSKKRFGGSSITEQLVKEKITLGYFFNRQTFIRRIFKLLFAYFIESLYTKEEILTHYVNSIPFGSKALGIYAASLAYFQKSPYELTLAEADILVSAIPNPPHKIKNLGKYGVQGHNFRESYEKILHVYRYWEHVKINFKHKALSELKFKEIWQHLGKEFLEIGDKEAENENEIISQVALEIDNIAQALSTVTLPVKRNSSLLMVSLLSGPPQILWSYIFSSINPSYRSAYISRLGDFERRYSDELIKLTQRHGLCWLLKPSFSQGDVTPFRSYVIAKGLQYAEAEESKLNTLVKIIDNLHNSKIRFMFVKGFDLGRRLYDSPKRGIEGDIDIWIADIDRAHCFTVLRQAGFELPEYAETKAALEYYKKSGEGISCRRALDKMRLDVHLKSEQSFKQIYSESDSICWRINQREISYRTLNDTELFSYLCHHASRHLFSRLIWLIDIHQLALRLGQERVAKIAREQLENEGRLECLIALSLINVHFGTNYLHSFELTTRQLNQLLRLRHRLLRFIYGDKSSRFQSLINRYTRSMFFEGYSQQLRYLWRACFTVTLCDIQEFSQLPLYSRFRRIMKGWYSRT